MPQKAKGWLRRKTYAEGEVWLFCYNVPRPGNRPAENSQLIGLVRDFPSENDAWREIQLKGYWKLVDPSLSISPTFGELAQHMLDSARVIPAAPLKAGFEFRYPEIGEALRDLVA